MTARRGTRQVNGGAATPAGLRACLVIALLVLHWSALPLIGLHLGIGVGGTMSRGVENADQTARPALPVRDMLRAAATMRAERSDLGAPAAVGPSDDPAAVLPSVVRPPIVETTTRLAEARSETSRAHYRRAFDARGPPAVRT
ncbi:hypothetical protein [Rhodoplanes azumiensis]|uniref:Uncharacterized protein n=1 Tax=Rhodoplanes azumiensis TaxID=1897628 RepID=A0ABW5ANC5_9BRAD